MSINIKAEKSYVWVIVDSLGNYAKGDSVKNIDGDLVYVSYKSFGPECRASNNLLKITDSIGKLRNDISRMGLSETFSLIYVEIDELTDGYREFTGENMVMREMVVSVPA